MDWHPYAKLFPMLPDAELQALADDIREHGQRHAICVDVKGRILDGRNRAAACTLAGVVPITEEIEGTDKELLAFVISCNLLRRHLTESQRAMVAAELANLRPNERKATSANLQRSESPVSQAEAAKLLNVSTRSVADAKKVQQKATPEVQEAVRNGELSVSKAAKIADLPKAKQQEAIDPPAPPKVPKSELMKESAKRVADALEIERELRSFVTSLVKSKTGAFVNAALMNRSLKDIRQELQRAVLAQPCKDCKARGCMLCKDVGYVPASHYEG